MSKNIQWHFAAIIIQRSALKKIALWAALLFSIAPAAIAQNAFLSPGWILDTNNSVLEFQSTKEGARGIKTEVSTFAKFEGQIDETGSVLLTYYLDSVNTNVDLRNVRMRFLFFETFLFPYAQVTAQLDPAVLQQLYTSRQLETNMPVVINLHGVLITKTVPVQVQLEDDNTVTVQNINPVILEIADFGLTGGLQKTGETVNVTITPQIPISFSFRFIRATSAGEFAQQTAGFAADTSNGAPTTAPLPVEVAATAALETQGEFSAAECRGRFEILSRTDTITFGSNKATLQRSSYPLLDSIVDIVNRCPSLAVMVAGHTDSVGPDEYNQDLSERRAASVVAYFGQNGVDLKGIESVGYGEARPAFPNTTQENRRRNRRIQFFSLDN